MLREMMMLPILLLFMLLLRFFASFLFFAPPRRCRHAMRYCHGHKQLLRDIIFYMADAYTSVADTALHMPLRLSAAIFAIYAVAIECCHAY